MLNPCSTNKAVCHRILVEVVLLVVSRLRASVIAILYRPDRTLRSQNDIEECPWEVLRLEHKPCLHRSIKEVSMLNPCITNKTIYHRSHVEEVPLAVLRKDRSQAVT